MEISNKMTVTRGERGRWVTGERKGSSWSRNLYAGPMDIDNRVGIDCGAGGGERLEGESNGGKIGTTVIEQQQKIPEWGTV